MLLVLLASLKTEEERTALTDIYNEHKYALLAAVYKICGNQQMAEDAVHNAFEQLIKKNKEDMRLSCIDFRRRYVIIVKNKAIDLMRREKIYSDEVMKDLDYEFEADETPVDVQVVNEEEYEDLRKHLEKLDDISRLVLEMKYVLNMSHKEIGAELGMSPEHVNTRIARAKAKVRNAMGREVSEHD
ncbi:MAG TPA: sigma-70 family RNA polymerase sigma factor [Anaerovoracaceae bacterium]|nr:sigma-70 family RNA polymerase sigma factor [Anaerovoracaceae bacterium]